MKSQAGNGDAHANGAGVTLATLRRAATAVGRTSRVELE
jgi:hypothetical protein